MYCVLVCFSLFVSVAYRRRIAPQNVRMSLGQMHVPAGARSTRRPRRTRCCVSFIHLFIRPSLRAVIRAQANSADVVAMVAGAGLAGAGSAAARPRALREPPGGRAGAYNEGLRQGQPGYRMERKAQAPPCPRPPAYRVPRTAQTGPLQDRGHFLPTAASRPVRLFAAPVNVNPPPTSPKSARPPPHLVWGPGPRCCRCTPSRKAEPGERRVGRPAGRFVRWSSGDEQ